MFTQKNTFSCAKKYSLHKKQANLCRLKSGYIPWDFLENNIILLHELFA